MSDLDFEISERVRVESATDLPGVLREVGAAGPVRLAGRASTQSCVPAPTATDESERAPTLVELGGLDRILRLEPGDLTCSVEPGVTPEQLEAALAPHRLTLPCTHPGDGATLGGIFARGDRGPTTPGGHSARTLILGFEGVLAEGLAFKAGAKVVKSVAGFDLQKALVGSRGRLFAVTALHLKLRPAPRHVELFFETGERERVTQLFRRARRAATPPDALHLDRAADGTFSLHGTISGRERVAKAQRSELELTATDSAPTWDAPRVASGAEHVRGFWTVGSGLDALLDAVPTSTAMRVGGGGQFDIWTDSTAATDATLQALAALGATAEILGGSPARRGRSTPVDPRARRTAHALTVALDPGEVLR